MSITINIKSGVRAEVARLAAAYGLQPEDYAGAFLEEAIHDLHAAATLTGDRTLREHAQFSHKIPLLLGTAFIRESLTPGTLCNLKLSVHPAEVREPQ